MNRKLIEKNIIENVGDILRPYGFNIDDEKKDLPNTYYFFSKAKSDFLYSQYLRFMKPNFIKCDSEIKISNKCISELVKKINPTCQIKDYTNGGLPMFENESFSILKIGIDKYVHPDNVNDIKSGYEWDRMSSQKIYIDDKQPINYENKAVEIVNTFFNPILEKIIPQTDSLVKIDAILNDFKELKQEKEEPPVLSICFPYSQQLAMGLILANYTNREDKKELTEKYVSLATEYGEDDYGYLDLLFKAAKYFQNQV